MDFISAIESSLSLKGEYEYLPIQPGDVEKTEADSQKLEAIIGDLDEKFSESGNPNDLEKANGFDSKNIAKIFYEKFKLAK